MVERTLPGDAPRRPMEWIGFCGSIVTAVLYTLAMVYPVVEVKAIGPVPLKEYHPETCVSIVKLLRVLWSGESYGLLAALTTVSVFFPLSIMLFCAISPLIIRSRLFCSPMWHLKLIQALWTASKFDYVGVFCASFLIAFLDFLGISLVILPAAHAYVLHSFLATVTTRWVCSCYERRMVEFTGYTVRGPVGDLPFIAASTVPLLSEGCHHLSQRNDTTSSYDFSKCRDATQAVMYTEESACGRCTDVANEISLNGGVNRRSRLVSAVAIGRHSFAQAEPTTSTDRFATPSCEHKCGGLREGEDEFGGRRSSMNSAWRDNGTNSLCLRPFAFLFYAFVTAILAAVYCITHAGKCLWTVLCSIVYNTRVQCPICHTDLHAKKWFVIRCLLFTSLASLFFFSVIVAWNSPILNVDLAVGSRKNIIIDRTAKTLGEILWKLRELQPAVGVWAVLLGFGIVVPSIRCVMDAAVLISMCKNAERGPSTARHLADGGCKMLPPEEVDKVCLRDIFLPKAPQGFGLLKPCKFLWDVICDCSMPQVLACGLVVTYIVFNQIDFFGASLPTQLVTYPRSALRNLCSIFNGFWATIAMAISSYGSHKLVSYRCGCRSSENESSRQNFLACSTDLSRANTYLYCFDQHVDGTDESPDVSSSTRATCSRSGADGEQTACADREPWKPSDGMHDGYLDQCDGEPCSIRPNCSLFYGFLNLVVTVILLQPVLLQKLDTEQLDINALNTEAKFLLEGFPSMEDWLPSSTGECHDAQHVAPQPCFQSGVLWEKTTPMYFGRARWINGLQSLALDSLLFDDQKNQLEMIVSGHFEKLSLSLRVEECLFGATYERRCHLLWDDTNSCCGTNIGFSVSFRAWCRNAYPNIYDVNLRDVQISDLVISEEFIGIFPIEIADITETVRSLLYDHLQKSVDPSNRWVRWSNGERFSAVEFLNHLVMVNAPGGFICPSVSGL